MRSTFETESERLATADVTLPDGVQARFTVEAERPFDDRRGSGSLVIRYERDEVNTEVSKGDSIEFGNSAAILVDLVRWSGFTFVRSPGMPAVFAGFALVLAACVLLTFPSGLVRLDTRDDSVVARVWLNRGSAVVAAAWQRWSDESTEVEAAGRGKLSNPGGQLMVMQSIAFWSATTAYALASVLFFAWLAFRRDWTQSAGLIVAALGLTPHLASIVLRWTEVGHGPFSTRYEVLSANAFLVVSVFLILAVANRRLRPMGVIVLPTVFLLMGWAVNSFGLRYEVPIIFKSYWLWLHIGFAKLFFVFALLAAAAGLAYLLGESVRRPADTVAG